MGEIIVGHALREIRETKLGSCQSYIGRCSSKIPAVAVRLRALKQPLLLHTALLSRWRLLPTHLARWAPGIHEPPFYWLWASVPF